MKNLVIATGLALLSAVTTLQAATTITTNGGIPEVGGSIGQGNGFAPARPRVIVIRVPAKPTPAPVPRRAAPARPNPRFMAARPTVRPPVRPTPPRPVPVVQNNVGPEALVDQPNQRDQNEDLWLAALAGNTGRVRALIEQGAEPEFGTRFGETPMHAAASRGNLETMIYLANHGGNVNSRTSKGWTPMHHAARFGRTEAVRYLLRMGAKPHMRTNDLGNKTPMQIAVDGNHMDIAMILGYRPR